MAVSLTYELQVLLGRWKSSLVAVKVLRKEFMKHSNSPQTKDLCKEAEMLHSLKHAHILEFLGACLKKPVRAHLLTRSLSASQVKSFQLMSMSSLIRACSQMMLVSEVRPCISSICG